MSLLAAWGRLVHRRRHVVLGASILVLIASLGVLSQGGTLVSYQTPANTQSGEAAMLLESQVPASGEATFALILSHPALRSTDAAFQAAAQAALQPLHYDERVVSVKTPYGSPQLANAFTSTDGHRILVIVALTDDLATARDYFPDVRAKIQSATLTVHATDSVAVYADINRILEEDLQKAEAVSIPLSLILLLIVFGTVVAALLPVGVGVLSVAGGVAGMFIASRYIDVAVYALNIVTLIGLGVAIDYSLFLVNRYREELRNGRTGADALAEALATAGRAILFSGLTVAIGLLGLTFYKGLFFSTMGMAGAIVVALAVLYSLTFLPALLAILGENVNRLRIPWVDKPVGGGFWARLAHGVMRRPLLVLAPVLVVLLLAGAPFLNIHLAGAGVKQLPTDAESRVGYDLLRQEFPEAGANAVTVVLDFGNADPLTSQNVGVVYDLSRKLADIPGVASVRSITDIDPRMGKSDYQQLYQQPRDQLPTGVVEALRTSVGTHVVVLNALTNAEEASDEARAIVTTAREIGSTGGARVLVTGATAIDMDTIDLVYRYTPAAMLFIVATTYVLLLVQTGSIVLPAKAILMNFLSIAASFGALVWIFQEGHFADFLGFTPAPIDPSTPVLLFCIVFGLSMDYEVLLLSRMHEEYEKSGDNGQAVAAGLEKSGRLITSAAGIMILVFGAFALAQVTIIKAIGLGLAIAILVDATLVRALVVPATMRLMGKWNWWAPKWVHRLWKAVG